MSASISKGHCCAYTQRDAPGPVGFGIDKLKVTTPVFSLDDWRPWNERPAPGRKAGEETAPEPRRIASVNGRDVYNGLYYNSPTGRFTVDIKPEGADVLLILNVNPSKIDGGLISDPNAVHDIMQGIHQEMRETLRVDFPLMETNISRIDLAADAWMTHPVYTYAELIRGSKAKPNAGAEYPDGFLFGDPKTWQNCIYDRGLKMEILSNQAQGIKAAPNKTHLMRNEARYMSRKYIGRNATFDTFAAMLETPLAELHRLYKKSTLHWLNLNQTRIVFPSVEFTQLQTVLHDCFEQSPRNAIRDFVAALTLENPDLHTIDFRTLIYEAYKSRALEKGEKPPLRSTLKRAYDRFQELRESASARRAVMQKDAENLHVSKLKELRTAFIQPYETAS